MLDRLSLYIVHPSNGQRVYLFLDPVHMMKPLRGLFEKFGILYDENDKVIKYNQNDVI